MAAALASRGCASGGLRGLRSGAAASRRCASRRAIGCGDQTVRRRRVLIGDRGRLGDSLRGLAITRTSGGSASSGVIRRRRARSTITPGAELVEHFARQVDVDRALVVAVAEQQDRRRR